MRWWLCFLGCGLRRGEALGLTLESIEQREEHWVIADLVGKGGDIRTVPMPAWVKTAVDAWTRPTNYRICTNSWKSKSAVYRLM